MEEEAKQSINEERIDNPDGSYTVKTVFKREHTGGFSSYIENFSADGKYLNGEYYNDENFSDVVVKQKIVYQDNGNIEVYKSFQKDVNDYKSFIETYSPDNVLLAQQKFNDSNFKDLVTSEVREYNEDGSYTMSGTYIYPEFNGRSVCIEKVDRKGIILEETQRLTKGRRYFGTIKTIYNPETKQYSQNTSLVEADNEGLKSYKKVFDNYNRLVSGEYYKTSNYGFLENKYTATYNDDNSYTAKFVYNNPVNGWYSIEENYDCDGNYQSSKGYYDKNFKKLGWSESRTFNDDGSYISDISYEYSNHNGNSQSLKYNSEGKFIEGIYYSDKEFKTILKTIRVEYNDDGTYYRYIVYDKADSFEFLPAKRLFDAKGKEYKRELYEDKSFQKLVYQEEYIYTNSGLSDYIIGEYLDGSGYTKGSFSLLDLTRNSFIDSRYTYSDKEYKNLIKRELYYLPSGRKGAAVKLTEYSQKQSDGSMAIIEAFDMQHKLISQKKYKNKLLAEFLTTVSDPLPVMILFLYLFLIVYCCVHYYMANS